jgi:hypothetical protein
VKHVIARVAGSVGNNMDINMGTGMRGGNMLLTMITDSNRLFVLHSMAVRALVLPRAQSLPPIPSWTRPLRHKRQCAENLLYGRRSFPHSCD